MFYQLEVNDIHTISASACVLIRFSIYHPGNVVWFGTVRVTLLIQAPRNLTKCSSTIYVSFNDKLMGEVRERLRKETAGAGGKSSLGSLCFRAPFLEGRESTEINKPQLSLNSFFPEFFGWGCGCLPERMPTPGEMSPVTDRIQKGFCEQWLWVKTNPVKSITACFIVNAKFPLSLVGQLQNTHVIL